MLLFLISNHYGVSVVVVDIVGGNGGGGGGGGGGPADRPVPINKSVCVPVLSSRPHKMRTTNIFYVKYSGRPPPASLYQLHLLSPITCSQSPLTTSQL